MENVADHAIPLSQAMVVLQMVFSAILVPAAFMLVYRLGAIRDHLAKINGNVAEINQWRADHDKRVEADDANHVLTRQQCQELHAERLRSVNERISELWVRFGDRRRSKGEDRTD